MAQDYRMPHLLFHFLIMQLRAWGAFRFFSRLDQTLFIGYLKLAV